MYVPHLYVGWWYGVVGHLELCDGNQNYCRCFESGKKIHEFAYILCRLDAVMIIPRTKISSI